MGNGPEASGEGWTFRGRGYIQLSGKDNYAAFAAAMDKTLPEIISYLETPEGGFMSAAWFWARANLNRLADGWEITSITKRINGGTIGATERLKYSNAVLTALETRP